MRQRISILIFLLVSGFNLTAKAQYPPFPAEWDRSSAYAAIESVNIDSIIAEFDDQTLLADAEGAIAKLKLLENREDLPLPAREAALYRFTRSLARLPEDAVAPGILAHLRNYAARTLVGHEDHAGGRVPLFNIRAAAAGVENSTLPPA